MGRAPNTPSNTLEPSHPDPAMDNKKDHYRQQFIIEVGDILDTVTESLLKAEADPANLELLHSIFRGVHTIKGSSAMFDMDELGAFAHHLEGVLNGLRGKSMVLTGELVDLLFQGLDTLREIMAATLRGEAVIPPDDLVRRYAELIQAASGKTARHDQHAATSEAAVVPPRLPLDEVNGRALWSSFNDPGHPQRHVYYIEPMFDSEHLANGFDPLVFLRNLKENCFFYLADCRCLIPEIREYRPLDLYLRAALIVITDLSAAEIRDLAYDPELIHVTELEPDVTPDRTARPEVSPTWKPLGKILLVLEERKITEEDLEQALARQRGERGADAAAPSTPGELKVMRVEESKIDAFGNTVGELIIARNAYDFLVDRLDQAQSLESAEIKALKDNLRLFARITNELQYGVMNLRMTPIRGIFQKFSRVVRDISSKQGKLIDMTIEGGETEIDKKVADILSDPLIHMIRNACDHGLEPPQERIAAGKPERGGLMLKAAHEGSNLALTITDDGRGIDRQRVFAKASRNGLPVNGPDDPDILDVIFEPGFSMKEEVSDISGRGVGMDVVRSTLRELGGTVRIDSVLGQGSTFSLTIPMSMGVTTALHVAAGTGEYALPMDGVLETVKIAASAIHDLGASRGMHYRGGMLPVAHLADLFPGNRRNWSDDEDLLVVALNGARGRYGLIIDKLLRNCEIAVKPVPDAFSELSFLGGVTILGDGRVLLVLNPELLGQALRHNHDELLYDLT